MSIWENIKMRKANVTFIQNTLLRINQKIGKYVQN